MIYGPYSGRLFRSTLETDIEHVVAVSEAHDSGLCAADAETRRRFATDLLNLTLASPEMNRCGKSGKCAYDAAQWLPPMNQCWFAARIVAVRLKYRLTVDWRDAAALERVLSGCASTAMIAQRRINTEYRIRGNRPDADCASNPAKGIECRGRGKPAGFRGSAGSRIVAHPVPWTQVCLTRRA